MADIGDIKWNIKKVGIFIKYIFLEPFRQLVRPRAWMYIFAIIFFATLIMNKRIEQIISFMILIGLFLWSEWESGRFMDQYRKDYKKKFGGIFREKN